MNSISIPRNAVIFALCVAGLLLCRAGAHAQARSFEVGQAVEIFCNCYGGNAWTQGKIESIDDSGYVVRYGEGRYQTKTVKFGSDRIRDPNQPAVPQQGGNQASDGAGNSGNDGTNNQTSTGKEETEFKVGETVEFACGNCQNSRNGWVRAKIVKIDDSRGVGEYILDSGEKNHRGEPKYYSEFVTHPNIRTLDEERNGQIRQQFLEAAQPFLRTFDVFDPNGRYERHGIINSPEDEAKYRADFQGVAALCQKFGKVTNAPRKSPSERLIDRPVELCAMAKQEDVLIAKVKANMLAESLASAQRGPLDDLENAFDTPNGMREETQRIVFDRAAWEREERAKLSKHHSAASEEMLKKYFVEIFARADEVKARIEREAPSKSWDAPLLHNAALEGMVRSYYSKYHPGVTVLKTGMYQNAFKLFKNGLGIPTSQVISGVALVKVANRPYCQSQIFELNKEYLGGGRFSAVKPLYIGREGTFVKCQ